MEKVVKAFRDLAYDKIDGLHPSEPDPIDALMNIDWDLTTSHAGFTQHELAIANQRLDTRFCLGRAAKAAALVENWYPTAELYFAEVRQDAFRNLMLTSMSNKPSTAEIEELLMYEEPHGIIVVNNQQFDPLSKLAGELVKHPVIEQVTVWEGLTAEWLASRSLLCEDLQERLAMLQLALELSPDSTNAKAIRSSVYFELEQDDKAMRDLQVVIQLRPNVRSLFFAAMFGDKNAEALMHSTYPQAVLDYVGSEFRLLADQYSQTMLEVCYE